MLENIILGFLLFRTLTTYDIKKALESSVNFFYSSSYGSIVPTLKKLEQNEMVSVEERVVNGRNRKEYTITEQGHGKFVSWLSEKIGIGKTQDEGLLRLYFLTELPVRRRIELLEQYCVRLQAKVQELKATEEEFRNTDVPEKCREAFNYRIITVDFGIRYYQFEYDWYREIIGKIERNEL
jgi:DNA-binding PadR family transcriptional regulator